MSQRSFVGHTILRRALRWALAGAAVSAILLTGLLLSDTTLGNSAFNISGVSKLSINYRGACLPGDLDSNSSITDVETVSDANQKVIGLTNNGDVFGCIGTDDDLNTLPEDGPGTVVIDLELFDFSNVAAETTAAVTAGQSNFELTVQNLTGDLGGPTGQSDWPNRFPGSATTGGYVYVGQELMQFSHKHDGSLHIIARGVTRPGGEPTTAAAHDAGSFVRAQGRLKLVGRRQPTFSDGFLDDLAGATTAADHASGATVQSPMTYLTCRARTDQTAQSGPDAVTSRARCYVRLEPHGPWPDPYPGPLLALRPALYHNISTGTIGDESRTATTTSTLVTGIGAFDCFPFVEDLLWVKVTSITTFDKDPNNKSFGEFRTSLYTNSTCTPPVVSVIGLNDGQNISSVPIASSTNTDGDTCTDAQELSSFQGTGGLRDPFNPGDFFDADASGAITIDDIFDVAGFFGLTVGTTTYDQDILPGGGNGKPDGEERDRGGLVPDADGIDDPNSSLDGPGPSTWNQKPPNGAVTIDDIFAVAAQFGHAC